MQMALVFMCLFGLALSLTARADDPERQPIAATDTVMTLSSGTLDRVAEDPGMRASTALVTLHRSDGTSISAVLRLPLIVDGILYPANALPSSMFGHSVQLRTWERIVSNGPGLVIDAVWTRPSSWSGEMYSVPATPRPKATH